MEHLNIHQLQSLSGIKTHTIRIWEKRYQLLQPQRTEKGFRAYSFEEAEQFLTIVLLYKAGYKISRLSVLNKQELHTKTQGFSDKNFLQLQFCHDLIFAMWHFDTERFESLLNLAGIKWGLDEMLRFVLLPFCRKINLFHDKSSIPSIMRSLVYGVVRQKMIHAIESISASATEKIALLFLFPGEAHELSMLHTAYSLKVKGIKIIYPGLNLSLKEVRNIIDLKQPHFILTKANKNKSIKELQLLAAYAKDTSPHSQFIAFDTLEN